MSVDAKLYVHGSKFHLDDLLCAAMGKILGYTPVRTLDKEICSNASSVDLVCDIGRKYDGVRFFDHHQPDAPYAQQVNLNTRFPFAKVAAAGLLWAAKGKDIIKAIDPRAPQECIQEAIDMIDLSLIAPSDRIDTGGDLDIPPGICTLSGVISMRNPVSQDPKESDKAFFKVLPFIVETLEDYVKKTLNTIYGRKVVESAPIIDGKIIVLQEYTPWSQTVQMNSKFDGCLYCVYPSNRGGWNGQCIPNREGKGVRKLFPIEWIGCQTDFDCAKAMGFDTRYNPGDNYFCHEGRWLIAVPTKDIAIEACKKAITMD